MSKQAPSPTTGEQIKAARIAAGLTQGELAEKAGLARQYVYQVESGREGARLETLWALAVALGINPHTLDERLMDCPRAAR